MTLFQNKYRVESAHLKDYDYSSEGDYYVTICLEKRRELFGNVKDKNVILSKPGLAAEKEWKNLPVTFKNISLGDFVFMPDHMHGIINIRKKTQKTLHEMIRVFKSKAGIEINKILNTPGRKIWQKSFRDRIIRDEFEYFFVSEYILNNPLVYESGREQKEWYELFEERKEQKEENP
jgi:putative transposase